MSTATVTETPSSTDRRDEKPLGGRFVAGAANYIERSVEVTVSKCRATDGVAPGYECP